MPGDPLQQLTDKTPLAMPRRSYLGAKPEPDPRRGLVPYMPKGRTQRAAQVHGRPESGDRYRRPADEARPPADVDQEFTSTGIQAMRNEARLTRLTKRRPFAYNNAGNVWFHLFQAVGTICVPATARRVCAVHQVAVREMELITEVVTVFTHRGCQIATSAFTIPRPLFSPTPFPRAEEGPSSSATAHSNGLE